MRNARRGTTLIELMVAMAIFTMVSTCIVVLLQHARVVTVWGEKRNDALRVNRETMRRVGYILRVATSRPAFGTTAAEPAVTFVTTTVRNPNPSQPPFASSHIEAVDFWATTEDARRLITNSTFPVPVYPAATSFDPRNAALDVPNNYSRMRLAWPISTGNLQLELRSNDGLTVQAVKKLTNTQDGYNFIRAVDFRKDDAARSVGMYLETRSRDLDSRFEERRYATDTQFQLPAWF